MNNTLGLISAFLGGAIVGAGTALLFAPEKGSELRTRIADILRKKGILCSDSDVDALVDKLTKDLQAEVCD
ncbi:MAG: YtxH domain-containing protein [Muribaculum sp.]|nr:YtxH domain-containing protein [Muribaculum sp.]